MSANAAETANERQQALAAFAMGEAVFYFRLAVERAYAVAGADSDGRLADLPSPPSYVSEYLGFLIGQSKLLTGELADRIDLHAVAEELRYAARAMRATFQEAWMGDEHQVRLWDLQEAAEQDPQPNLPRRAAEMLFASTLSPSAWHTYERAADRLGSALPCVARELFDLARLLTTVAFPLPSDYDPEIRGPRANDPAYLEGELQPLIDDLSRRVAARSRLLDGLPEWRVGAVEQAERLRQAVWSRLAPDACAAAGTQSADQSPAQPSPSAPPATSDPSLSAVRCDTAASADSGEEDLAPLLARKERMDPKDTYIGFSVATLRLFRDMEELNRLSDDPVVILGPSGCGKTLLARRLHATSERRDKPFRDLSADDLVGGDETIHRGKWTGYGPRSGLKDIPAKEITRGWLEQAEGGTIFVDELHNLDERTLNFLRKILDGREIPRAAGNGDPVIPNVRLVFATYKPFEELCSPGKLPHDFVRRLRGRFLTVPPLSERKEDIPLFVEQFRDRRVAESSFLLALLRHDWHDGEVDELISAIRSAVARRNAGEHLTVSDLRGLVPAPLIAVVSAMSQDELDHEVYSFLLRTLERQGFADGKRGASKQKRLAEILGIHDSTVSRRRKELGLKDASVGSAIPTS